MPYRPEGDIPALDALLDSIDSRAVRASRQTSENVVGGVALSHDEALKMAEEVMLLIGEAEVMMTRAQSLQFKLRPSASNDQRPLDPEARKEIDRFVYQLLEKPEVKISGAGRGHVGSALQRLLANQKKQKQLEDRWITGPGGSGQKL